jgi:hypothetical protein
MIRRIYGVGLALVSAGALLRFHAACGLEAATAAVGSFCLVGMALALAFARPRGVARPPIWLGAAAIACGAALGVGAYTVRFASTSEPWLRGAGSSPVLCEIIVDDGEASRLLIASAARLRQAMGRALAVVAYRASEFVRPGLARGPAAPAPPAAFVDYRRTADAAALAAAVGTASERPRLELHLELSARGEPGGEVVARITAQNTDPRHAFNGEVMALLVREQTIGGQDLTCALAAAAAAPEVSIPPSSRRGPWEVRFAVPAGVSASDLQVIGIAADEFVETVATARVEQGSANRSQR